MGQKKKINWLLILQGWAMLWVVIGHAFLGQPGQGPTWENVLYHFAYSFHMPLFMLISGYLYCLTRLKLKAVIVESAKSNNGGYKRLIINKIKRLIVPGLTFSIVALVLKLAFPGEMSRSITLSLQDVIHMYLYPWDNPMRELWFIVALFWMFVLSPLWKYSLKSNMSAFTTTLLLLVIRLVHPDITLLCIDRVMSLALFFYLGIVMCKYEFVERILMSKKMIGFILSIIIYSAGLYTHPLIITIGGILMSFVIAIVADKYAPKLFFSFRRYTYQIFLMGIFAQIFIKILYRHLTLPYIVWYVLCIIAGLYVPVILAKIVERINCRPFKMCFGLS